MSASSSYQEFAPVKTETIHGMIFDVAQRHVTLRTEEGHGAPISASQFALLKYMFEHMDEDVDSEAAYRVAVIGLGITKRIVPSLMADHIMVMVKALNGKLDGIQDFQSIRVTRNGQGLYLPPFNPVPRM